LDEQQGLIKLLGFISYFEDDDIEYCKWQAGEKLEDGISNMPYPVYDDRLQEFIRAVDKSGLMNSNYLAFLKDKIGPEKDILKVIDETNDRDVLLAALTYFVRQERFSEGIWGTAAKDKVFLRILLKLRSLNAPFD